MSKIGTPTEQVSTPDATEQLSLLSPSGSVPLQFRLSERTRISGLAHVAALRAQLAQQAALRSAVTSQVIGRRQIAA